MLIKEVHLFGLRYAIFSFLSRLFFNRISLKYLLAKEYKKKSLYKVHNKAISVKDKNQNLVSIVIPVNNALSKGYLDEVINSLFSQTWKNIEVIAVDSGSTDDTVGFLKERGVKVIEIKPKLFTHAYSRNTGAAAAKGKFILFTVDDAIFFDSEWISKSISYLEYFKADAISTNQLLGKKFDNYSCTLNTWHNRSQSRNIPLIRLTYIPYILRGVFRSLLKLVKSESIFPFISIDDTNHLIRKEVFDEFRFSSPTVEDLNIALRLILGGKRIIFTNLFSIQHNHLYPANYKSYRDYLNRIYIDLNELKNNPLFANTASKIKIEVPYVYLSLLKNYLEYLQSLKKDLFSFNTLKLHQANWFNTNLKLSYYRKLYFDFKSLESDCEISKIVNSLGLSISAPPKIKVSTKQLKLFNSILDRVDSSFQYLQIQSLKNIESLLIYLTLNEINEFICRSDIKLADTKFSDWK